MRYVFFVLIFVLCFTAPFRNSCAGPSRTPYTSCQTDYIAVLWVNGSMLKALSLVSVDRKKRQVGIIAVPTCTIASGDHAGMTFLGLYEKKGRTGVMEGLSLIFKSPVKKYLLIPQHGLEIFSRCIGRINVMERDTTLQNVFEGTYVDSPVDLQVEIRSLAASIIKPPVLAHFPKLLFIFATEFQTNAGLDDLILIYRLVYLGGPDIIRKNLYKASAGTG